MSRGRRSTSARRARPGRSVWGRLGCLVVVLVLGALAGAGWLWWSGRLAPVEVWDRVVAAGRARHKVTLYFADPRWTRLVAEEREIPAGLGAPELMARLVEELASGPGGAQAAAVLPKGARLRGAYLGEGGLALLDFDGKGLEGFSAGGASGELLTVFALVHTVVENVPGVREVQILVDGQERETLAGHVKISEPLSPDTGLTGR